LTGVPGEEVGIMLRLFVLTAGLEAEFGAGVWRDELATENALSLLRERFDEDGETGTPADAMSGSVRRWAPLIFALRLKARNLCNLTTCR
jgi:hypothetical protein